jgi:hypothetical protein
LIADRFPAGQLATATSIYASGVYVGTAAASLSALLNAALGWRASFLALAAAGLALAAAAAALVSEPRDAAQPAPPGHARAGAGASAAEAGRSVVGESVRSARAVLATPGVPLVLAATAARFAAGYSIGGRAGTPRPAPARRREDRDERAHAAADAGVWNAPLLRARFPMHQAEFAALNAAAVAGGGCLSSLAGGVLADRLSRSPRRPRAPGRRAETDRDK